MHFDAQVFELPKDVEHPEQNQDAWAFSCRRGVAALADGVASSLFARAWARILTEAAIDETPDPGNRDNFDCWVRRCRETWTSRIDVSRLAWFQKAKLRDGAFATLLSISLVPPVEETEAMGTSSGRLRGFAVGDSCLFLVRDGKTVRTFPLENASQLEARPMALGSIDLKHDALVEFSRLDDECFPGDLVVLVSDAVAEWALRQREAGTPVDWERFWDMPEEDWQRNVMALRDERQMRYDDTTMILLRVVAQRAAEEA